MQKCVSPARSSLFGTFCTGTRFETRKIKTQKWSRVGSQLETGHYFFEKRGGGWAIFHKESSCTAKSAQNNFEREAMGKKIKQVLSITIILVFDVKKKFLH